MVSYVKSKKIFKIIGIIIASPFAMLLINSIVVTIFNLGTYCGTVIRYLLNNIIC